MTPTLAEVVRGLQGEFVRVADPGRSAGTPVAGVTIYLDANNNGVLDAGEKSVLTNSAGSYTFNGLAVGLHRGRVQPKVFYTPTAPATGVHTVLLGSGMTASNRNFGERFRPIIIDPVFPPKPLPQPIPLPIPQPDPGPLAVL